MINTTKSHTIKELEQEKMILEEINQSLEEKEFENKEILNSMSHEFRTPLVIIKSYVDMTLDEKFGKINSIQRQKLEHVKKNIDILITSIFKTLEVLEDKK